MLPVILSLHPLPQQSICFFICMTREAFRVVQEMVRVLRHLEYLYIFMVGAPQPSRIFDQQSWCFQTLEW